MFMFFYFFFFNQKTAFYMPISDWSSDVCSSDLGIAFLGIFMNCTGGHDCRTLQYYMGFSDARQVPLERFNEWNREKRFARAYRDESGDPVLEMDVDVDLSGLPRENIRETLNTWASLMTAYREFIFPERRLAAPYGDRDPPLQLGNAGGAAGNERHAHLSAPPAH